jgi:hypothetical protein
LLHDGEQSTSLKLNISENASEVALHFTATLPIDQSLDVGTRGGEGTRVEGVSPIHDAFPAKGYRTSRRPKGAAWTLSQINDC